MKKYLVIGNPIKHSLSPKLHNYWFKKNNIDANYDKKKIDKNEIQEIISEYTAYGEERFSSKMQQIINNDVFQSAKVNLNDLIQF